MSDEVTLLKSIGVRNFKAFGDYTELSLGQLTVLAGLNSCGKSSIYQSILLIAQSVGLYIRDSRDNRIPYLRLNGVFAEFGTPEDVLHDITIPVFSIVYTWSDACQLTLEFRDNQDGGNSSFHEYDRGFYLSKYSFSDAESEITLSREDDDNWSIRAVSCLSFQAPGIERSIISHIRKRSLNDPSVENEDFWPFLPTVEFDTLSSIDITCLALKEFSVPVASVLNCIESQYRERVNVTELVSEMAITKDVLLLNNDQFYRHKYYVLTKENVTYIEPFRGYPRRIYTNTSGRNPLAGYSKVKDKVIKYRHNFGGDNKGTVQEALHYWLVDVFQLADGIEIKEIIPGMVTEIFLVVGDTKITINNVGFGTSQIVPVIYKILVAESGTLFIVDEPEIHLHASIQSKLASFFFEMMLIGKHLLIETHSEYLIDKLVYHNILLNQPENVASLCWVKKTAIGSVVEKVEHDHLGYLLNSPTGFMSEKRTLVSELNELRMSRL